MPSLTLEALLRRDRWIVVAALSTLTLLAWAYLLWVWSAPLSAKGMPGMGMPGMGMPGMGMPEMDMPGMDMSGMGKAVSPALGSWSVQAAAFTAAMWLVMMVGMMTPSAAPMILIYARVARQAVARQLPFTSTAWFAGGYFLVWIAFALLATAAQWALEEGALLADMALESRVGGLVLLAAALYQISPLKRACLRECQSPLAFIQRHGGFPGGRLAAMLMGVRHGAYCVGCCWALMALLFVGGIMNILWIAGLTVLVLLEKVVPWRGLTHLTGTLLGALALWMLWGA